MALSFWIPPFEDLPAYSEGALSPATAHWTMGQLIGFFLGGKVWLIQKTWEQPICHLYVQQLSQLSSHFYLHLITQCVLNSKEGRERVLFIVSSNLQQKC